MSFGCPHAGPHWAGGGVGEHCADVCWQDTKLLVWDGVYGEAGEGLGEVLPGAWWIPDAVVTAAGWHQLRSPFWCREWDVGGGEVASCPLLSPCTFASVCRLQWAVLPFGWHVDIHYLVAVFVLMGLMGRFVKQLEKTWLVPKYRCIGWHKLMRVVFKCLPQHCFLLSSQGR